MKKIFSLICLFVFVFFGVANTVLASTDPENTLTIEEVRVAFETYLKQEPDGETGISFNVKEVICDSMTEGKCNDSASQLIVVPNDTEIANYVFDYNKSNNTLSYNKASIDPITYTVDVLLVQALTSTIAQLHGFTEEESIDFFDIVLNSKQFPYEIDGFYFNSQNVNGKEGMDALMSLDFTISLNPNFKFALAEVLDKDISGEEPEEPTTEPTTNSATQPSSSGTTEKPADNPGTSDMTLGNIILIGGCLLLITGYGVVKLKKIK